MYNVNGKSAAEFIDDTEIRESILFAERMREDKEYLKNVLEKARKFNGLTHREAIALLECRDSEIESEIFALAKEIKHRFYGDRIVMFAPLYLSNYCVNGCVYCPYHGKNRDIVRRKLTQAEILREVIALQDMGHKRIAIELGEHPVMNPIEYVLESIDTIYGIRHKNGAIRRINVNIAATTVDNYRRLRDAKIGTYILFQETYNKENYEILHPTGPKSDYAYHTEAMDRAMQGGIEDVGIGVLFGLEHYRYDFVGLLMHAEHLEAVYGVGPHTISVPRIRPAADIDVNDFDNGVADDIFVKLVALLRIAVPYTGLIVSTRESREVREKLIEVGVSQLSGGSRTSVGGYSDSHFEGDSSQFEVSDNRTLDEVVEWLLSLGQIPSFCTACYGSGRTGDKFMSLVKAGRIANMCGMNAIVTLAEYMYDYAGDKSKELCRQTIERELAKLDGSQRNLLSKVLVEIARGKRGERF